MLREVLFVGIIKGEKENVNVTWFPHKQAALLSTKSRYCVAP